MLVDNCGAKCLGGVLWEAVRTKWRRCSQAPHTFMSSLLQVSQSGDILIVGQSLDIISFLMLTVPKANSSSKFRDCLFPGGEEGAGGVLVAEEAFYQVHWQTFTRCLDKWMKQGSRLAKTLLSWVFTVCIRSLSSLFWTLSARIRNCEGPAGVSRGEVFDSSWISASSQVFTNQTIEIIRVNANPREMEDPLARFLMDCMKFILKV